MRNRPWPLVLLAVIQILTPLFTIGFNAVALRVPPSFVLEWILQRPPLEVFERLFLMPIAGIAILRMRRWTYVVFFLAMLWSVASKLQDWRYATHNHSALSLAVIYLFQILLAVYFLLPSVRRTYFDPAVRWWESKPRYELKLPGRLTTPAGARGVTVLNVSEGGVFVTSADPVAQGQRLELRFDVLGQPFALSGEVVHERQAEGRLFYGIRFDHTPETGRRMQRLTQALELLGFQDRTPMLPWFRSLVEWAVTLLRTGRGLTPELKFRRK
jgi:hypothetical protein